VTTVAYKFLDAQGRAPFTGFEWPVGEWVEAAAVSACSTGVHGCRVGDLSHWIAASLWYLELDGDVIDTAHKVVGRRGRLLGPVDGYDEAMSELRATCAWSSLDRAVEALRRADDRELSDRFATASTLAALAALGAAADETTFAGRAAALAADCAHFAIHGVHAQAPFVAACSAGHAAAGTADDQLAFDVGYADERSAQSSNLAERLSLS
jgi:hypothetical protein